MYEIITNMSCASTGEYARWDSGQNNVMDPNRAEDHTKKVHLCLVHWYIDSCNISTISKIILIVHFLILKSPTSLIFKFAIHF